MKTKNKVIALVEIAVMLCSLLVVAIPAIAAEQTTQEVSTSASEVTTASEDDYVLDIYGNANEDDTIDMRDLTYVKLIFFGKKPETELADAKYDGKINPLDFIQIKLIIVGKEKELTVNIHTRSKVFAGIIEIPVTVRKPIERIVCMTPQPLTVMRSLKVEKDKIVGVVNFVKAANEYFPEFSDYPSIGDPWTGMDYEAILNLHPDLVVTTASAFEKTSEKLPGVTVVAFECFVPTTYADEIRRLGYILDKEDEAEEFIDFHRGVLNTIKEKVDEIPEEDRPKVHYCVRRPYFVAAGGCGFNELLMMAGGNNLYGDQKGFIEVDPESVIKRNPDIIVKWLKGYSCYLEGIDKSKMIDEINAIRNLPELGEVKAVKNRRVYILMGDSGTSRHFVGVAYMAKWFHPELFEDFDPHAIHQEYITRFQGLPDDFLDTHGLMAYPEEPV